MGDSMQTDHFYFVCRPSFWCSRLSAAAQDIDKTDGPGQAKRRTRFSSLISVPSPGAIGTSGSAPGIPVRLFSTFQPVMPFARQSQHGTFILAGLSFLLNVFSRTNNRATETTGSVTTLGDGVLLALESRQNHMGRRPRGFDSHRQNECF